MGVGGLYSCVCVVGGIQGYTANVWRFGLISYHTCLLTGGYSNQVKISVIWLNGVAFDKSHLQQKVEFVSL